MGSVSEIFNPLQGCSLALEVDEILTGRGGEPEVFSARGNNGDLYLVVHVHGQGRSGTWLCAPVTDRALECVRSGRAELRDVVAHSSTGRVERVTLGGCAGESVESVRLCGDLTDDDLPRPGLRLHPRARCA